MLHPLESPILSHHIVTYHVRIIMDTSENLLYTIVPLNSLLVELVASGQVIHWWFVAPGHQGRFYEIHIYYPSSATFPGGENLEEINRRALRIIEEQEDI